MRIPTGRGRPLTDYFGNWRDTDITDRTDGTDWVWFGNGPYCVTKTASPDTPERLHRNVPGWHCIPGVWLTSDLPRKRPQAPWKAVWLHRRIAPRQLSCGWKNYRARMR